jgi:hypothetical protein
MPGYQYTTVVMTHGFMGRKSDELDRSEFERNLNEMGAQGWELEKVLLDINLHREKDGHVLIFKRRAARPHDEAGRRPTSPAPASGTCATSGASCRPNA